MPESPALSVALLCGTRDDVEALRDVLREARADIVYEADTASFSTAAIREAAPQVVLVNLPAAMDEHSPMLEELAATPGIRVVFNDASITSALDGWDRARWQRHLRAKLLGVTDDLPPRPDDAPALRVPQAVAGAAPARGPGGAAQSERVLAAEMNHGLAQIADTQAKGPPPRHDWASELHAEGLPDSPLDSEDTGGVAQEAMGVGMESETSIEREEGGLDLNDDERRLLGSLQTFDADADIQVAVESPMATADDPPVFDPELDISALPAIHVADFPPNDREPPLGAADEDLRRFEEVTSDDGGAIRLEAPSGFADLALAPMDAHAESAAPAPPVAAASEPDAEPAYVPTSRFGELSLESEAGAAAPTGRASFSIDTAERFVVDLTQKKAEPAGDRAQASRLAVWVLLGGAGSDVGITEFLGELPATLSSALVVAQTEPGSALADTLGINAWPVGDSLTVGQAVALDMTRGHRLDDDGRLQAPQSGDAIEPVENTLRALAGHYGSRLGLLLFEGGGTRGMGGIEAVATAGGTIWAAATDPGDAWPWRDRARELGALALQGTPAEMAARLSPIQDQAE